MKKSILGVVLIAAMFNLLTACAAKTQIKTNKSQSYAGQPRKIFAVLSVTGMIEARGGGTEAARYFYDALTGKMSAILGDCGVEFSASNAGTGANEAEVTAALNSFQPDAILQMQTKGYTGKGFDLLSLTYEASLLDKISKDMVWRANLVFDVARVNYKVGISTASDFYNVRGAALAVDLTNQMKKDGLLGTCPLISPQK